MEYVNLIHRIMEAEQSAQTLVQDVKAEEQNLADILAQEVAQMREIYMEKARVQIAKLTRMEEAMAKEDLSQWDEKLSQTLVKVEETYSQNKDQWAETLFYKVIGGKP